MLHRNVEASSTYVDDRLSHEEPKSRMQKLRSGGLLRERRTPLLTWLADNGLAPDVPSKPTDGSAVCSPLQVAEQYQRLEAAERLRSLHDGLAFLALFGAEATDAARLRAAVECGNVAAVKVLLWRSAEITCAPELHAHGGTSIIHTAATRGDVPLLVELLRHGAAEAAPANLQPAQQAAVATRRPEASTLLERFARARKPLEMGSWRALPASASPSRRRRTRTWGTPTPRGRCATPWRRRAARGSREALRATSVRRK